MIDAGFLVFPNFNILDLSGPLAAFDVPRREVKPTPYRLTVFSETGGAIRSSCGVSGGSSVPMTKPALETFAVRTSPPAPTVTTVTMTWFGNTSCSPTP